MTLRPGAYQLGSLVFGAGTNIIVETFDKKPYDLNTQDYQLFRSDFIRFGWDQIKATNIQITMHVLHNRYLPEYGGQEFPSDISLNTLETEWKSNDVRYEWGAIKPLYYGTVDGDMVIAGRPGQFGASHNPKKIGWTDVVCEYRRGSAQNYTLSEFNSLTASMPRTASGHIIWIPVQ